MKSHPILFSTSMIQALLEGRKTMTRRVMKHQPHKEGEKLALVVSSTDKKVEGKHHWTDEGPISLPPYFTCPYGQPGDLLWVRETHMVESNRGIDSENGYPPPFYDGRPIRRITQEEDFDWGPYWRQCHYKTDPLCK